MKKKVAVLSLTFACALAFGASSIPTQSRNIQSDLNYTLDRLENFANVNYDLENPQNMLLNDDYSLFYNNGNYGVNYRDSNMFGSYFTPNNTNYPNASGFRQDNSSMNSSQNYSLKSTTPFVGFNKSNNLTTQSLESSNQNYAGQNSQINNPNYAQNKNLSFQTQQNSNNYTNSTNTSLNNSQTNQSGYVPTYSTNNISNVNRTNYNSNVASNTANTYKNNQTMKLTNTNTTTTNNQNNTKTSVLSNSNTNNSLNSLPSTKTVNINTYQTSLQSTGTTLKNDIQTLKNTLNGFNPTNLQQASNRALQAYTFTLKNITNKLEYGNNALLSGLNKLSVLKSGTDVESKAIDACNLDIKSTLASRMVLLECADEAVVAINSILSENNKNLNTNSQNMEANLQTTNQTNYANNQNSNVNLTNKTTFSNTNNVNSNPTTSVMASAKLVPEDGKAKVVKESNPVRVD